MRLKNLGATITDCSTPDGVGGFITHGWRMMPRSRSLLNA